MFNHKVRTGVRFLFLINHSKSNVMTRNPVRSSSVKPVRVEKTEDNPHTETHIH